MASWDKDLIRAVEEIDNNAFFDGDCTILFFFGTKDDGERYVDAEMVSGHIVYGSRETHNDLGSILDAEDFGQALEALSTAYK